MRVTSPFSTSADDLCYKSNNFPKDLQLRSIPHRCPVCCGRSIVPKGFYGCNGNFTASDTMPEQCRSCHGLGIIYA